MSQHGCSSRKITENGDNDDDEVEDVPRLAEVVPAQADELDDAFEGEDGDEDGVDVLQNVGQPLRLVVVLDRHRRHVQQNHQHYADVELLIRRQLEEAQLTFQLHTYTHIHGHAVLTTAFRVNLG